MKKTVSIPQILEDFLIENPELSPSKMLQSKITEVMDNHKISATEINRLKRTVVILQKHLLEATDEIDNLKEKIKVLENKIDVLEKNSNKGIFGSKKRS